MERRNKILKSAGTVGLLTALSRIFGYFRDASLAWVLGAGLGMDAFTVAYRLANLFRRLVGEGAMSAAFVPVFVQYQTEHTREELWKFVGKFFYTLALVAAFIVGLEIVFAPILVRIMAPGFEVGSSKFELTVLLTRLMAPYLLFAALAALLMGILNSFGRFAAPALNPVLFNLSIITATLLAAQFAEGPVVMIAFGVLVGGALQVFSQLPSVIREGMTFQIGFSFRHPAIQKIGTLLLPSIFGIGIVQINLMVDSLMASFLREGSISQLYYADRVMELVLGIFTISLATVILPDMAQSAASKKIEELKGTLLFSLRAMAFVAIPATVGLFVLADPIIHVLFERGRFLSLDTEGTAVALAYYALGLFFISSVRIIVSAFYSLQDTKTPVKVAFVALITNIVLNWILMHPLKQGGIALATSLASMLSVFQLLYIFQKRYGTFDWKKFWASLSKILTASAVMGIFCLACLRLFRFSVDQTLYWKVIGLFGTIGLGTFIYLAAAMFLKADEGVIL
ncbi:MAG: murein biosynthesis integral membrane protein MurJ, partial [Candidatus Omnitrophica bacterium]|nr:murein biosynthesis integral membrane protein MurJ [Candidatus Omnitrophota bacterium]